MYIRLFSTMSVEVRLKTLSEAKMSAIPRNNITSSLYKEISKSEPALNKDELKFMSDVIKGCEDPDSSGIVLNKEKIMSVIEVANKGFKSVINLNKNNKPVCDSIRTKIKGNEVAGEKLIHFIEKNKTAIADLQELASKSKRKYQADIRELKGINPDAANLIDLFSRVDVQAPVLEADFDLGDMDTDVNIVAYMEKRWGKESEVKKVPVNPISATPLDLYAVNIKDNDL